MPIHNDRARKRWTSVNNLLIEGDLSADELAVMVYLLSKPPDWKLINKDIQNRFGFGYGKVTNIKRTLQKKGHLSFHRNCDGYTVWNVFETPGTAPQSEKRTKATTPQSEKRTKVGMTPQSEKPQVEKPQVEKRTVLTKTKKAVKTKRAVKTDIDQKPLSPSSKATKWKDDEDFCQLNTLKPKREGGNPVHQAWLNYKARLVQGHTHEEMKTGLINYREYCLIKHKIGTEHVMQLATFLGPKRMGFTDDWTITKPKDRDSIPRGDDDLWPWAKRHGYPDPGSMTYRQYRQKLEGLHQEKGATR